MDSSGDDDSGFSEYFSSCSLKALKRRKYIMGDIMIVGGYKSDKKFVSSWKERSYTVSPGTLNGFFHFLEFCFKILPLITKVIK